MDLASSGEGDIIGRVTLPDGSPGFEVVVGSSGVRTLTASLAHSPDVTGSLSYEANLGGGQSLDLVTKMLHPVRVTPQGIAVYHVPTRPVVATRSKPGVHAALAGDCFPREAAPSVDSAMARNISSSALTPAACARMAGPDIDSCEWGAKSRRDATWASRLDPP